MHGQPVVDLPQHPFAQKNVCVARCCGCCSPLRATVRVDMFLSSSCLFCAVDNFGSICASDPTSSERSDPPHKRPNDRRPLVGSSDRRTTEGLSCQESARTPPRRSVSSSFAYVQLCGQRLSTCQVRACHSLIPALRNGLHHSCHEVWISLAEHLVELGAAVLQCCRSLEYHSRPISSGSAAKINKTRETEESQESHGVPRHNTRKGW
jgi:hypothetical protein